MSRVIDNPNTLVSFKDKPTVNVSSFINNLRMPSELRNMFFPRRAKKSLQLVPNITIEMIEKNNLDITSLNRQLEALSHTE